MKQFLIPELVTLLLIASLPGCAPGEPRRECVFVNGDQVYGVWPRERGTPPGAEPAGYCGTPECAALYVQMGNMKVEHRRSTGIPGLQELEHDFKAAGCKSN